MAQAQELKLCYVTEAHQLKIEISDNGPGLLKTETLPSIGLGLRITRERLESVYGRDQSLELLSPPEGGGTTVLVCIPFRVLATDNGRDMPTEA
jgi:two-component system LytT family sensor kinase